MRKALICTPFTKQITRVRECRFQGRLGGGHVPPPSSKFRIFTACIDSPPSNVLTPPTFKFVARPLVFFQYHCAPEKITCPHRWIKTLTWSLHMLGLSRGLDSRAEYRNWSGRDRRTNSPQRLFKSAQPAQGYRRSRDRSRRRYRSRYPIQVVWLEPSLHRHRPPPTGVRYIDQISPSSRDCARTGSCACQGRSQDFGFGGGLILAGICAKKFRSKKINSSL